MADEDKIFVDELLGQRITTALNLRGLHVERVGIEFSPAALVVANVRIAMTVAQFRQLLEEFAMPPENRR